MNNALLKQAPAYAGTVLIVEDDASLRTVAENFLQIMGYKTFSASSGPEALDIIYREKDIDVLFTDVVIVNYKMNGVMLAEKLVEMHPEVKILLTSGYPVEKDVLDKFSGEDSFVTKPYSWKELEEKVGVLMEST